MTFMPVMIQHLTNSKIVDGNICIPKVALKWPREEILKEEELPLQISEKWPRWTDVKNNGVLKSSLMTLGVEHFHED